MMIPIFYLMAMMTANPSSNETRAPVKKQVRAAAAKSRTSSKTIEKQSALFQDSLMFSVVPMEGMLLPKAGAPKTSADDIVGRVQKFYVDTKVLEAKFRQTVSNKTFGRETTSDGKVYLSKPGKMRWDYYKRKKKSSKAIHSKSFISDGKTLWAVMVEDKQFYKKTLKDDMLPVAVSFLTGDGDLRRDFKASLDKASGFGGKGDIVLKLVPKTASAAYKTLWLVVDSSNYRVKSSVVLNAKGDTNKISFFAPKTDSSLAPTLFRFDEKKNKGYKLMEPPQ